MLGQKGPWKAKVTKARNFSVVYVCAGCRQHTTLLKCGPLYGCPNCVAKAGGREQFATRFLQRAKGARQKLEDAMAKAARRA